MNKITTSTVIQRSLIAVVAVAALGAFTFFLSGANGTQITRTVANSQELTVLRQVYAEYDATVAFATGSNEAMADKFAN